MRGRIGRRHGWLPFRRAASGVPLAKSLHTDSVSGPMLDSSPHSPLTLVVSDEEIGRSALRSALRCCRFRSLPRLPFRRCKRPLTAEGLFFSSTSSSLSLSSVCNLSSSSLSYPRPFRLSLSCSPPSAISSSPSSPPSSSSFASRLLGGTRALASDGDTAAARDSDLTDPPTRQSTSKLHNALNDAPPKPPLDSPFVDFGFEKVDRNEKVKRVGSIFSSVAHRYDLMNDLMSLGIHRVWKDEFVNLVDPVVQIRNIADSDNVVRPPPPGDGFSHKPLSVDPPSSSSSSAGLYTILDLAGGTGDIAFRLLEKAKRKIPNWATDVLLPRITVCDMNAEMLRVGHERAKASGITEVSWVLGDGEALPFPDGCMDLVTIAFGIRNFSDIPAGLKAAYRVLKPGGRFLCLEFSKVENRCLAQVYDFYSFNVIPLMGRIVANDRKSYQYLVESIRRFPDQEAFSKMIQRAGFEAVHYSNLSGGIVAIHSGFKLGKLGTAV